MVIQPVLFVLVIFVFYLFEFDDISFESFLFLEELQPPLSVPSSDPVFFYLQMQIELIVSVRVKLSFVLLSVQLLIQLYLRIQYRQIPVVVECENQRVCEYL